MDCPRYLSGGRGLIAIFKKNLNLVITARYNRFEVYGLRPSGVRVKNDMELYHLLWMWAPRD